MKWMLVAASVMALGAAQSGMAFTTSGGSKPLLPIPTKGDGVQIFETLSTEDFVIESNAGAEIYCNSSTSAAPSDATTSSTHITTSLRISASTWYNCIATLDSEQSDASPFYVEVNDETTTVANLAFAGGALPGVRDGSSCPSGWGMIQMTAKISTLTGGELVGNSNQVRCLQRGSKHRVAKYAQPRGRRDLDSRPLYTGEEDFPITNCDGPIEAGISDSPNCAMSYYDEEYFDVNGRTSLSLAGCIFAALSKVTEQVVVIKKPIKHIRRAFLEAFCGTKGLTNYLLKKVGTVRLCQANFCANTFGNYSSCNTNCNALALDLCDLGGGGGGSCTVDLNAVTCGTTCSAVTTGTCVQDCTAQQTANGCFRTGH